MNNDYKKSKFKKMVAEAELNDCQAIEKETEELNELIEEVNIAFDALSKKCYYNLSPDCGHPKATDDDGVCVCNIRDCPIIGVL